MGCNYYLVSDHEKDPDTTESDSNSEQSKPIHIGKSSAGWKFLFDTEIFEVWRDNKDPRWKKVANIYDYSHNYITTHIPSVINGIISKDIWDLLNTRGYHIVSEYNEVYPISIFKKIVIEKDQLGKPEEPPYYIVMGDPELIFSISPFE